MLQSSYEFINFCKNPGSCGQKILTLYLSVQGICVGIQGAFLTPFSAVLETTSKLDVRASPPNIQ
jgi:hypothetical protein